MIKPWFFLATAVALTGLCLSVATPTPRDDAFTTLAASERLALDRLSVEDLAELKLFHLDFHPPYDVLILGNSRPLPLRPVDLGMADDQMFNAALTGESLRSSVLLLEHLAQYDRLPRIALISWDNAELNYYGNPQWPPTALRWIQMGRDIWAGLTRPGITASDLARMMLRHAATEATLLTRKLNAERVWRGLRAWGADRLGMENGLAPRTTDPMGYLADGSRPSPRIETPYRGQMLKAPNRNLLPGYVDYDLERLAALQRHGMRVIIFETMLHPDIHARAMVKPSSVAAESRQALVDSCARHGIECHPAPADYAPMGELWWDDGHPPAPVLAAWITSFLSPAQGKAAQ